MAILGLLVIGFGIIDFAGMFFGYDLTGVSWSPIAAGFVGSFLLNLGGDEEAEAAAAEAASASVPELAEGDGAPAPAAESSEAPVE